MNMDNRADLSGKVALISGCGAALAASIAKELSAAGARVAINQKEGGPGLEADGSVLVLGDASDPDIATRVVKDVEQELGSIDILVFGASESTTIPFIEHHPKDWWRQLNINLSAGFFLLHRVLPAMRERREGRILFVTPGAGVVGWSQASADSAASAGLITLTKTLGRELAPHGVLVNAVATGAIDAPPYARNGAAEENGQPWPRLGTSTEIASVVGFLASGRGSGFVGHILQPNGGEIRSLA